MANFKRSGKWTVVGCLVLGSTTILADDQVWSRYLNAGEKAYQQRRYTEAEQQFEAALKEAEGFPAQDPRLATSLSHLARLYRNLGRYLQAESLHRRALLIREKTLGPLHPDLATTLNDLALVYHNEQCYSEAEALYVRALSIWEKIQGTESPHFAASLSNLARLYETIGQSHQAEQGYRRALVLMEKAWGPEHPDVATCLNNLGKFYVSQGRYTIAEPLLRRSLVIEEKSRGSEHPEVATILNNLGALYYLQGQYSQSEALYQTALAIRQAPGAEDVHVAPILRNYAILLHKTKRKAEARKLLAHAGDMVQRNPSARQSRHTVHVRSLLHTGDSRFIDLSD